MGCGLPGALARARDDAARAAFRDPLCKFAGLLVARRCELDAFRPADQDAVDPFAFGVPHKKECRSFCHKQLDDGVC